MNLTLFSAGEIDVITEVWEYENLRPIDSEPLTSWPNDNNAELHTFCTGGNFHFILLVNADRARQQTGMVTAALLAHEAVHVWQKIRTAILAGNTDQTLGGLGEEFEAYAVQNIFLEIMAQWVDRGIAGQ